MNHFLVCEIHKEVLGLGMLIERPNPELRHPYASMARQNCAISKFLIEHSGCNCVIENDVVFWGKDRAGYRRMDNAYGLPFKGPDAFVEDEVNDNEYVAQYKANLAECDDENANG